MPRLSRRGTTTHDEAGTAFDRAKFALLARFGWRRSDGPTNRPLTYMTVEQAVSLLESVEPLGGKRSLLDVTFTDGGRTRLSHPSDLAGIENVEDVDEIAQVTRFRGQGKHTLLIDRIGITNTHDRMEDTDSPACAAVVAEYERLRLRPAREAP